MMYLSILSFDIVYTRFGTANGRNEISLLFLQPMDETNFDQLIALLEAGQQWHCKLMFSVDTEHVVNLCDYMHRDFLPDHVKVTDTASFPPTSRFRFSPELYGDGIKSLNKLRKDLVASAKQAGFVLVTLSSVLRGTSVPYIVFGCSRHQSYRSTRGKSYSFSAEKVTADDVKEQVVTVRRNKTKQAVAFNNKQKPSASKGKSSKLMSKHPTPSTPAQRRRNATTRVTDPSHRCPFSFRVFLHSDGFWYLFMSINKMQVGLSPSSHCYHEELSSVVTRSSSRHMSFEELERIRQHNGVHLSTSLSAHLLSSLSDNLWLPSQVSYVCSKTKALVADLNKASSSADRLLTYLRDTPGISYIVLTDDANGGLIAKRGKGRPKVSSGTHLNIDESEVSIPVPSSFCAEHSHMEVSAMRKGLMLTENQKMLLMVCWVTDVELRLVQMYPEVFFMDVTAETNNEGRGLFLVAGKDGNNSGFTAARIFLPSEQMWVFQWIFSYALPTLFSTSVIQFNQLCVTDGDKQVYHPLNQLQSKKDVWRGTHMLCEFHLLVIAWRKKVLPFVSPDAVTEAIAITAYQWIQSWFWDIESESEFDVSLAEFYLFLTTSRTDSNAVMLLEIRNFVLKTLIPVKLQWLRCYFLYSRSFNTKANSVVESQNSSLKHGTVKVSSNLGIETATQRMTDYANLVHSRKAISVATTVLSTPLWSNSGTKGWLTDYAEGIVCSNMDRRLAYRVVQGKVCDMLSNCLRY